MRWMGSFCIEHITEVGVVKLITLDNYPLKDLTNVIHLKPYYGPQGLEEL